MFFNCSPTFLLSFLCLDLFSAAAAASFVIRGLAHYFISCDKMTKDYSREILNTELDRWDLPSYVTQLRCAPRPHISYFFSLLYTSSSVVDIRNCVFSYKLLFVCFDMIGHHKLIIFFFKLGENEKIVAAEWTDASQSQQKQLIILCKQHIQQSHGQRGLNGNSKNTFLKTKIGYKKWTQTTPYLYLRWFIFYFKTAPALVPFFRGG